MLLHTSLKKLQVLSQLLASEFLPLIMKTLNPVVIFFLPSVRRRPLPELQTSQNCGQKASQLTDSYAFGG